jgi:anti-anti-sigma factor
MSTPTPQQYVEWEEAGDISIIRFTMPFLREDRIIRQVFEQMELRMAQGRTKLVINFSGLQAFASYAIGKLIVLNTRLQGQGGRLALCSLSPMVEEIIDLMTLRKRFPIYATESEAIASFSEA